MKKIFLKTIITSVVILYSSFFSFSQADNAVAYQPEKNLDNDTRYFSVTNSENLPLSDVNIKAARSFAKQFKNVSNAKWYKVEDVFIASFTENEIETKVVYDLKGNWHCMLRTYNEDKLPFDVRDLVKAKYYDYKIHVVYEITHTDDLTYILKIEDSKKIKTLRVTNGEMEVIGDYVRS
jgi:hypothetical protein